MLTTADNHDTLYLNPWVFAPMLSNNLVACNLTLHITNALTITNFADTEFGDTFIDNLNDVINTIAYGFYMDQPGSALNKEQWLQATTQLMATSHQGLYKAFPLKDIPEFLASLGPDDMTAIGTFAEAIGTLNYYLKNTSGTY